MKLQVVILLFSISAFSQSDDCNTATPFCTNSGITFPASTGTSSPNGPDYGCLNTQPNPAFFYLQIDNPGNMTLSLFSTPSYDIDFICWGPFSNPNTMCNNLTSWNIEDCSYSWFSNETCQINGASTGFNSYNMKIFDRWGGIIFDEDDLAWDGNTNGKIIGGLYSYSIKILDFKDKPFIYTGIVNLIR
jgi:hypothetical protein